MTERKLVTVRIVSEVLPIQGADKIEQIKIDGWSLVSGKGNFKAGGYCLFFEIDSFLPLDNPVFAFLESKATSYNGVRGARIKTIKLKGTLSQGLALPITDFGVIEEIKDKKYLLINKEYLDYLIPIEEGVDLTSILGVVKWEPHQSGNLSEGRKGNFPIEIPKTDEERIQNIFEYVKDSKETYQVTQKMDGSSMTVFIDEEGKFGVCSRNFELEETESNLFWKCAREQKIKEKLELYNVKGMALQGELIGPGVNGNRHKLDHLEFKIFNVFDMKEKRYVIPVLAINLVSNWGLDYVPLLSSGMEFNFKTIEEAIQYAESVPNAEGVVFKVAGLKKDPNSDYSFKIISNKYLLKYDL